jgi:hypothetical protein
MEKMDMKAHVASFMNAVVLIGFGLWGYLWKHDRREWFTHETGQDRELDRVQAPCKTLLQNTLY